MLSPTTLAPPTSSVQMCLPSPIVFRAPPLISPSVPHLSPYTTFPLPHTVIHPCHTSHFSHPNPFATLESDDSDDESNETPPAFLCSITPSPILADSGAMHVLLRESVLPSLSHLMRPFTLPPMPFTLPDGSILTAKSGGHLHFPRFPFPVPFWSAPDSSLAHSLLAISPLLQSSGSCLLTHPQHTFHFCPGGPDTRSRWL